MMIRVSDNDCTLYNMLSIVITATIAQLSCTYVPETMLTLLNDTVLFQTLGGGSHYYFHLKNERKTQNR